jgi:hypothetical protein
MFGAYDCGMTGFKLPKLKWLLVGAVAAGVWAMNQEPPKREHWQRQRAAENAPAQEKMARVVPRAVEKPSPIITSSIPRPQKPVAAPVVTEMLRTTEKVRLRRDASTSAAVVAMLRAGQPVEAGSSDGKWRKVSVDGMVGWVHGDYLTDKPAAALKPVAVPTPVAVLRPKVAVAPQSTPPVAVPVAANAEKSIWGALRPKRAPQGGDCQCPYDLMLNGQQCGERSAYAKGRSAAECFF